MNRALTILVASIAFVCAGIGAASAQGAHGKNAEKHGAKAAEHGKKGKSKSKKAQNDKANNDKAKKAKAGEPDDEKGREHGPEGKPAEAKKGGEMGKADMAGSNKAAKGPKNDKAKNAKKAKKAKAAGKRAYPDKQVEDELQKHTTRVAKIQRLKELAAKNDNAKLAEKADSLLTKERKRHQKKMELLAGKKLAGKKEDK